MQLNNFIHGWHAIILQNLIKDFTKILAKFWQLLTYYIIIEIHAIFISNIT